MGKFILIGVATILTATVVAAYLAFSFGFSEFIPFAIAIGILAAVYLDVSKSHGYFSTTRGSKSRVSKAAMNDHASGDAFRRISNNDLFDPHDAISPWNSQNPHNIFHD